MWGGEQIDGREVGRGSLLVGNVLDLDDVLVDDLVHSEDALKCGLGLLVDDQNPPVKSSILFFSIVPSQHLSEWTNGYVVGMFGIIWKIKVSELGQKEQETVTFWQKPSYEQTCSRMFNFWICRRSKASPSLTLISLQIVPGLIKNTVWNQTLLIPSCHISLIATFTFISVFSFNYLEKSNQQLQLCFPHTPAIKTTLWRLGIWDSADCPHVSKWMLSEDNFWANL